MTNATLRGTPNAGNPHGRFGVCLRYTFRWLSVNAIAISLASSAVAAEVQKSAPANVAAILILGRSNHYGQRVGRGYLSDKELLAKEIRIAEENRKKEHSGLFRAWCSVKSFFCGTEDLDSLEWRRLAKIHMKSRQKLENKNREEKGGESTAVCATSHLVDIFSNRVDYSSYDDLQKRYKAILPDLETCCRDRVNTERTDLQMLSDDEVLGLLQIVSKNDTTLCERMRGIPVAWLVVEIRFRLMKGVLSPEH